MLKVAVSRRHSHPRTHGGALCPGRVVLNGDLLWILELFNVDSSSRVNDNFTPVEIGGRRIERNAERGSKGKRRRDGERKRERERAPTRFVTADRRNSSSGRQRVRIL